MAKLRTLSLPGSALVAQFTRGRTLARATSLLALGDVFAKLLAFVFFIVLARAMSAADYGVVRYSITLGNFGAVLAGALAITLSQNLASRSLSDQKFGAFLPS